MAGARGDSDNNGDYESAARRALSVLDVPRAVYEGTRALRKAMADEWRRRPADAGLIAAHVAAGLLMTARELPGFKPERPARCPRVPRPEDLLATFDAVLAGQLEETR